MTSRQRRRDIREWFEQLGGVQASTPLDDSVQRELLALVAELLGIAGDLEDKGWALYYSALGGERRARAPTISAPEPAVPAPRLIDDAMTALESIVGGSAPSGQATGFRDIDSLLGGLMPGSLTVIAGRPGIGKSSLALNIARNVAIENGATVVIFSIEMSCRELELRMLTGEARVPLDLIRNRRVGQEDWERIASAADVLHDAPFHIQDSGALTLPDCLKEVRRLAKDIGAPPLGLVVVDYLQLMSHHRRVDNRAQEVGEISRGLKMLAKELHVPVIAVSQLNRDPERRLDKRPQLSDLRESGSIEQDADIVMLVHRDDSDPARKGLADLIVAKNRNGPTDTIQLTFLPHLTQFRDFASSG